MSESMVHFCIYEKKKKIYQLLEQTVNLIIAGYSSEVFVLTRVNICTCGNREAEIFVL